jgi:hypothetical protein
MPTSTVVATWYATHSDIRRLRAIEDSQGVRIIVTLEPTLDGNDTYPAWIANSVSWAHELQLRIDSPVTLELIAEPAFEEIERQGDGVIVADLCWRDPCVT